MKSYTLPDLGQHYTQLILKAGAGKSANDVRESPEAGDTYRHSTGKDLSHIIYCDGDGDGDETSLT